MKEEKKISGFSTMSTAVEFAKNYNKWIFKKFEHYIQGNILEIGTGKGNFKNSIKLNGLFVSIDIDDDIIANAKTIDPHGIYFLADISDINTLTPLKEYIFHTVICFNVLEHINKDQNSLENMIGRLEDNGYLLIFVPAFQSLFNDKDRLAGHVRRYTKKTLFQLLKTQKNVQLIKLEYFNPIGGIGHWFNKFIKHQSLNNKSLNWQTNFFDKYLVNLSKAINPITVNFFGQSLICVIQKKCHP